MPASIGVSAQVFTFCFIEINPANNAKAFTFWSADRVDGYLQEEIFSQEWGKINIPVARDQLAWFNAVLVFETERFLETGFT
jgi:hypothetical protein